MHSTFMFVSIMPEFSEQFYSFKMIAVGEITMVKFVKTDCFCCVSFFFFGFFSAFFALSGDVPEWLALVEYAVVEIKSRD